MEEYKMATSSGENGLVVIPPLIRNIQWVSVNVSILFSIIDPLTLRRFLHYLSRYYKSADTGLHQVSLNNPDYHDLLPILSSK